MKLEGNLDDMPDDLLGLLTRLKDIHAAGAGHNWKVNLKECSYLGPWAITVLHAAFMFSRLLSQKARFILPEGPEALRGYCRFAGIEKAWRNGETADPDHPKCETIPIEQFCSADWDHSRRIVKLLERHTIVDEERKDQIQNCIHEVMQNVVDHADSRIGGVLSARYFEGSKEVRVGIVDRGIGIAESLKRKHPEVSGSFDALNRVIKGGFSSLSRPNNMGLGISNLFEMVQLAGGRLLICTGDASAQTLPGRAPKVSTMSSPFPGTSVFFSLPLSRGGAGFPKHHEHSDHQRDRPH